MKPTGTDETDIATIRFTRDWVNRPANRIDAVLRNPSYGELFVFESRYLLIHLAGLTGEP